jgi:hypothetical protein
MMEGVGKLLAELLVQPVNHTPGLLEPETGHEALEAEVILFVDHDREWLAS